MSAPLVPCPTCPWRKSSTAGGFDIPGFDLDKMRNLRCTIPPPGRDAFCRVMACHYSAEGGEEPCRGYVARIGWDNINLRILAARGLDVAGVIAASAGVQMWASFEEMLVAYEAADQMSNCGRSDDGK